MKKINKQYLLGITWFIASLVISCGNDVITKYLGTNLHPMQVAFLRFFFGTLSLLPFMLYNGKQAFQTSRPIIHIIRGTLLFVAITIWCFGLNIVPILSATLLTFTIPFFVLILAPIFLKETVSWPLWTATILGFAGVILVLDPTHIDFNPLSLLMLSSALLFASLDKVC
jgi:S-adenosylmethionine uptake transporter